MNNAPATVSDLTWPEVQEKIEHGCKIAILPFGHTEQHGPHLPFGSDNYFISAATKRGAELANKEVGKTIALVFPTLPFGNGGKFANGELRLRPSTFISVFTDLIQELEGQGFTKVVLASGHGSNEGIMWDALNELSWQKSNMDGYIVSPYSFIRPQIKDVLESDDYGHACEIETSIALHLFPELVHMDRIPNDSEQPEFWLQQETIAATKEDIVSHPWPHPRQVDVRSMPGYVGRPKLASKEKGEMLLNAWIRAFADFLKDLDRVAKKPL